jgi:hypothetical protein
MVIVVIVHDHVTKLSGSIDSDTQVWVSCMALIWTRSQLLPCSDLRVLYVIRTGFSRVQCRPSVLALNSIKGLEDKFERWHRICRME